MRGCSGLKATRRPWRSARAASTCALTLSNAQAYSQSLRPLCMSLSHPRPEAMWHGGARSLRKMPISPHSARLLFLVHRPDVLAALRTASRRSRVDRCQRPRPSARPARVIGEELRARSGCARALRRVAMDRGGDRRARARGTDGCPAQAGSRALAPIAIKGS